MTCGVNHVPAVFGRGPNRTEPEMLSAQSARNRFRAWRFALNEREITSRLALDRCDIGHMAFPSGCYSAKAGPR
jgi:hypothetical protein